MLIIGLNNTLPTEGDKLAQLLWSVIDAATECECGAVSEGMIFPGVHGDTIVRVGNDVAFLSPYIWRGELAAPYPRQCECCGEWIGAGGAYYHRALNVNPHFPDSICKACGDTPSTDIGDAFASPAADAEWDRFAEWAMQSATSFGGGC